MAKQTTKPTRRRHKKMLPKNAEQIRSYARQLDAIARRIHRVADDMEGADIADIEVIPQGIESACDLLNDRVETEFERRLEKIVKQKARQDAEDYA